MLHLGVIVTASHVISRQNFFLLLWLNVVTSLYHDRMIFFQMRLRISIRGRVRPFVGPAVPSYFWTLNMAALEDDKTLTDIVNNGTVSDDEVVAANEPRGTYY